MLRKSVAKEGKKKILKKMKNRKKKSLMKNVHRISKMLGGPNVSYDMFGQNSQKETQITRENKKVLDLLILQFLSEGYQEILILMFNMVLVNVSAIQD
jgi:hypothetical protein